MQNDLQNTGNILLENITTPLNNYANRDNTVYSTQHTANSCEIAANSKYRYKYKGLYVEMKPKITYRLFDYLDELTGKEEVKSIDIDND
jgi:hypothetical protein